MARKSKKVRVVRGIKVGWFGLERSFIGFKLAVNIYPEFHNYMNATGRSRDPYYNFWSSLSETEDLEVYRKPQYRLYQVQIGEIEQVKVELAMIGVPIVWF